MTTTQDLLGQLLEPPEQERTALANALLDSLEAPADANMTPEEFRAEMKRRADEALAAPDAGTDWPPLRDELARS